MRLPNQLSQNLIDMLEWNLKISHCQRVFTLKFCSYKNQVKKKSRNRNNRRAKQQSTKGTPLNSNKKKETNELKIFKNNLLEQGGFKRIKHKNLGDIIYKMIKKPNCEDLVGLVRLFIEQEKMVLRYYFSVVLDQKEASSLLRGIEDKISEMIKRTNVFITVQSIARNLVVPEAVALSNNRLFPDAELTKERSKTMIFKKGKHPSRKNIMEGLAPPPPINIVSNKEINDKISHSQTSKSDFTLDVIYSRDYKYIDIVNSRQPDFRNKQVSSIPSYLHL